MSDNEEKIFMKPSLWGIHFSDPTQAVEMIDNVFPESKRKQSEQRRREIVWNMMKLKAKRNKLLIDAATVGFAVLVLAIDVLLCVYCSFDFVIAFMFGYCSFMVVQLFRWKMEELFSTEPHNVIVKHRGRRVYL